MGNFSIKCLNHPIRIFKAYGAFRVTNTQDLKRKVITVESDRRSATILYFYLWQIKLRKHDTKNKKNLCIKFDQRSTKSKPSAHFSLTKEKKKAKI